MGALWANAEHKKNKKKMKRDPYGVVKYVENKKKKHLDIHFTNGYAAPYVVDKLTPGGFTLNATPCIQNLCTIQQGGAECQRIGNKVAVTKLKFQLVLNATTYATLDFTASRIMVVYDRQTNGAYPNVYGALLSYLRQDGVTVSGGVTTFKNPNNTDRFEVLYDKLFFVPGKYTTATGYPVALCAENEKTYMVNETLELPCLETLFNGSALNGYGALGIDQVSSGAIYLLAIGENAAGAEPYYIYGDVRVTFVDC